MFTRFSMLLSGLAVAALLFCADAWFWHVLPLGFEGTLFFGALVFWLGLSLSIFSTVFAGVALAKNGKNRSRIIMCIWSAALVLAFGLIWFYVTHTA
jgi:hypothetical protein